MESESASVSLAIGAMDPQQKATAKVLGARCSVRVPNVKERITLQKDTRMTCLSLAVLLVFLPFCKSRLFLDAGCRPCDDVATPQMTKKGQDCANALNITNCNNPNVESWWNNRFCRMACYKAGNAYEQEACCTSVARTRILNETMSTEPRLNLRRHAGDSIRTNNETSYLRDGENEVSTFVTVIGAGAAGLSAAYTLRANGIQDVIILEASSEFGGRVRKDETFTDFPMDLGPSFVQFHWDVRRIVGPSRLDYAPGTGLPIFSDYTWHDFFADNVADPSIIVFDCQVDSVNYTGSSVEVACGNRIFVSSFAIVTVPLPVLKEKDIAFEPELPTSLTVDHPAWMWGGFKIFIEFTNNFYNEGFCFRDIQTIGGWLGDACINESGESLFWDYSSVHPSSSQQIMAGYILGMPSNSFVTLDDAGIAKLVLYHMDAMFGGLLASRSYKRHFVFNWSMEPFIRGSLSSEASSSPGAQLVNGKVLVAGEAFPPDGMEWGWVDSGVYSGDDAAKQIIWMTQGRRVTTDFYREVYDQQR